MEKQYIISIIWLAGFLLGRWMLKAEHEAEGHEVTHGDNTISVLLAILSWALIMYLLATAWAKQVKNYWAKPVKAKKTE